MPKSKTPDNLQDFTTQYLQKPVQKIIEEVYALRSANRELREENKKFSNVNPESLKEEIKRLRAIEKKYNQIMSFATGEIKPTPPAKKPGRPPKSKTDGGKSNGA